MATRSPLLKEHSRSPRIPVDFDNQSGRKFLASPADGTAGAIVARAITPADLPLSDVTILSDDSSGTTNRLVLSNATGPTIGSDRTDTDAMLNVTFDLIALDANVTIAVPPLSGTMAVGTFTGTGSVYVRQAAPTIGSPTITGNITLPGGLMIMTGAGDPAGVVAAPVGTLYLRNNGGAGTTMYVKEVGVDENGWAAK